MMETSKHRYCNDLSSLNASMRRRCFPAGSLRAATVEDVRDALARITAGVAETTGRQYVLRVKSLLGYAHPLGYAPFNADATIRERSDARNRGATLAKRIISEVDVALLVRGGRTKRNRVLLEVLFYAGGLRVSEVASLAWADVLMRDKGQVQLSITGKGGIVRQALLPEAVSRALLALRGDAGANDAVFASRKTGAQLAERAILGLVKRAAARAGLEAPVSPHWLRHAPRATPSTAAPRCPRCSRRQGTATSRRRPAICTRAPNHRAGWSWILECFFDEGEATN
jgi:site-specific recombinase XerD